MRTSRWRWFGLLLALLLLVAGLLWWRHDPPPPAPVAAPQRERARKARSEATNPHRRETRADAETPREIAIPVGDSGQPIPDRPLPAQILVRIVYPDGQLTRDTVRVFSPDCYVSNVTRSGELSLLVIAQTCTLRAARRDGALWALSDEVELALEPGGTTEIELVLPRERTGGLGVQIAQRDEGIEVMAVLPDTPAARAGLEVGDIIVEVDGLPTDALTAQEFIEVMTGPEGTDVDFVIAYEADTGWDTEEHTITRSTIAPN